jgi:transcriptional regulator with XRE-family HTH domain
MDEPSLGIWLRRERERRGITLRQIAEQTKVAVPLLEGLEADDLSRWPAGIYRKGFVRSYAASVGLEPDAVVERFEREHPAEPNATLLITDGPATTPAAVAPGTASPDARRAVRPRLGTRARVLGTAADLAVAIVLGLGSAAAGSRLLWPVLFIALYYALGVLLTGTSPMVALLSDAGDDEPRAEPAAADAAGSSQDPARTHRPSPDRRTSRRVSRAQRGTKTTRPRVP